MLTLTPRVFASALIQSIWCFAPSTRAIQVRRCSGSRRCASSKTAEITLAALSTTLAVSHLLAAALGAGALSVSVSRPIMSLGVRITGVTA